MQLFHFQEHRSCHRNQESGLKIFLNEQNNSFVIVVHIDTFFCQFILSANILKIFFTIFCCEEKIYLVIEINWWTCISKENVTFKPHDYSILCWQRSTSSSSHLMDMPMHNFLCANFLLMTCLLLLSCQGFEMVTHFMRNDRSVKIGAVDSHKLCVCEVLKKCQWFDHVDKPTWVWNALNFLHLAWTTMLSRY